MASEPVGLPTVEGDPAEGRDDRARFRVRVIGGRDEQFAAFVDDSGPYLLHTAELLCGDRARAQDLVQTTFERTYRSWDRAREGDPRAYARRVLVNLRIDGWRRTRRELLLPPEMVPDRSAADHAPGVVARDAVIAALSQLPVGQRRVVVMRHLLDLSESQVARELGIAIGTVKSTNSRALVTLRALLSEGDRS